MMAAAGRGETGVKELEETVSSNSFTPVKELIRQKNVSAAVQTTTEEGLVPLPVSGATKLLVHIHPVCSSRLAGRHVQHPMVMCSMLITVSDRLADVFC